MDQFNKVLSFVLGLVVVAVFIIVASGKFNLKGFTFLKPKVETNITPRPTSKPWFSFNKPTVTPTTKPTPKVTPQPTANPTFTPRPTSYTGGYNPNYHSYSGSSAPTSIPNTGVPLILFPLLGTSLLTGIFMKKKGK